MSIPSALLDLQCTRCRLVHDADRPQRFCTACRGPLYPRYDLTRVAWDRSVLRARRGGLWRWSELLPVREARFRIHLGEGDTPLLPARRLGARLGIDELLLKDEGLNPTGSFKARGLCMAVSRAWELGTRRISIPTAGNAGSALAAYCARAGLQAIVYMPVDTPDEFKLEVRDLGAHVVTVPGTIADAAARMTADAESDWFPVSTLQEPYRIEGKKTMGFEIAEQLDWSLPDVIVYPTGGGTGLVGMWKAFDELQQLGLIGPARPRMVCVQASGCAPVVRAFAAGRDQAEPWTDASTMASGLRVPRAFADREILAVLRESNGTAVTVSDADMLELLRGLAAAEGIYAAPEAAATLAAARDLRARDWIAAGEQVVCFLTGNAYKYLSSLR